MLSSTQLPIFTTKIDGQVRIRTELDDTIPILTVPQFFRKTVDHYGDNMALSWKSDPNQKNWKHFTYKQYYQAVRKCAKAFLKLGLEKFNSVCILGFNSPEWFISDLAAIYAGGVAAGIYTTNSPEACYHCCYTSNANIVVVEDNLQLDKILQIRHKLPKLKAIVQYSDVVKHADVISWETLMKIGENETDSELDVTIKNLQPNECCTLVYTSGTVGNPKAVMLSHDNLIYSTCATIKCLDVDLNKSDTIISYLPLSHVAAQIIDIYATIHAKAHIYFADKNALKGSLINTLLDVQPTEFLGVPRVFEKIYEKMQLIAAQNGAVKRAIASWAKQKGLEHNLNRMNGVQSETWGYFIAKHLVFKHVKQALGFNNCRNIVSAAAPLSTDIKKYFLSLDICILEAFGMSEASGAHTFNTNDAFRLDSIGRTISGMKTKIDNPDTDGNGEICLLGRNVFMGYLNEIDKTKEAIDNDGWLHSGDLGRIDQNGFVYITGRIKELLITAGGENVPPIPIEQMIKNELPHISNAMLIGDQRKFLTVLLTLKCEIDPETGVPSDNLESSTIKWLTDLGCEAHTITEMKKQQSPKLREAIQQAINRVNEHAVSNAQRIQRFLILPADFSIVTGELGPTMKMKRRIVLEKYSDIIEELYK